MTILEKARKVYARLAAQRNGHIAATPQRCPGYERNELNEKSPPPYRLVNDATGVPAVVAALDNTARVGMDTETTGLDPRTDRVRLLSLTCDTIDGGTFTHLVDCFTVNPSPLWEALAERELVLHNAAFDLAFLARLGFTPGVVHDVMLLSRLLNAGTFEANDLAGCASRELGLALDKAHQKDDWSGQLTPEQLAYASKDAVVLVPLYAALAQKVEAAGLAEVAKIETRALPAFLWLSRSGVAFDRAAWGSLTREAEQAATDLAAQLDAAAPPRTGFPRQRAENAVRGDRPGGPRRARGRRVPPAQARRMEKTT